MLKKTYENTTAGLSAWVYEDDPEDDEYAISTDLAGYSSFVFTFGSREDRDAFLILLQHVKEVELD